MNDINELNALIDNLGLLQANIAEMSKQERVYKARLQATLEAGTAAEGDLYRVSHSVANRDTVSWKEVAQKLNPSRQLVTAHTKTTEVHTIKVTARSARAA